jgi:hypothetical protein
VKCFCNARNAIPYIQDIEIINTFCDGVSDVKTVEEIAMKKPRTVADLLAIADICIEAADVRAQLLESSDHKERRSFHRPDDAKKWCEIYRTSGHYWEECKTFLNHKKMPPPAAPVAQEPRRGEQRQANPNDDEQMGEINMIFGGSMSIISKTQGKKLEREISLAQCIEPRRKMKWSDVDISFGPEDHPETELSERNLPFVVKLPIERHKVSKTLIDNGASLNLIMRKTSIEMGLNLKDLTPRT